MGGAPPPLPIRLSRVGRRPLKVPSRKRGEGSTCLPAAGRQIDPSIPRPIRDVPVETPGIPTAHKKALRFGLQRSETVYRHPSSLSGAAMNVCIENVFTIPPIEAINVIQATAEENDRAASSDPHHQG